MTSVFQKWAMTLGLSCIALCLALPPSPARAADTGDETVTAASLLAVPVPGSDKKTDGEIESIRREIKGKPVYLLYLRLGYLLLKQNALHEALQSFDEALQLKPRSHEAKTGKGIVLGRQGEFEKAEQLLQDALALNPNPERVHYERGLLFERRGDADKAIAEFKESLNKYHEGRQ